MVQKSRIGVNEADTLVHYIILGTYVLLYIVTYTTCVRIKEVQIRS